jgi:hypothetical protein
MTLNSSGQPPRYTQNTKSLYLAAERPGIGATEYLPYFYAEVRIDFNDVRTGLRDTFSLSKAMDIYSTGAELLWTKDMSRDVDTEKLTFEIPVGCRCGRMPDFVDAGFISRMETQFVQYLMRSFVAGIYRNTALNIYSLSGESKADFIGRCRELFDGPLRKELDLLREVFTRRLEQLKEKYLASSEPNGLELARIDSQNRDIYSHYSDCLAELFLRRRHGADLSAKPPAHSPAMPELEERLAALGFEAQNAITKITNSYEEKARLLDEYLLHPNLKDIHFVRSCILWMPKEAN